MTTDGGWGTSTGADASLNVLFPKSFGKSFDLNHPSWETE